MGFFNFLRDEGGLISGLANTIAVSGSNESYQSAPTKIKIKPIQVLEELEKIPTPWTLMGIDDKIEVLKDKEKLIVQQIS